MDIDILVDYKNDTLANEIMQKLTNKKDVISISLGKRDKRYIEQYIIKAIIEYSKQNTEEADNVIVQDLIF